MGEKPDDLDAVALGLKRGHRGAVTFALVVALAVGAVVVVGQRGVEVAPVATSAPVADAEAAAPPAVKPVSKRSRGARVTPRREPVVTVAPSVAAPSVAAPSVAVPSVAAPSVAAPSVAAPSVAAPSVAAPSAAAVAEAASLSEPTALPPAASAPVGLVEDTAVVARESAPVAFEPPPPAPAPEPEEDSRDGNGEAIARSIAASKRAAVRACFEHELKQAPKLSGTVVVELDLAPQNKVNEVRVSDDLERPAFTRCVEATMRTVRFAELDEEVSVRVPYALTPGRK